MHGSGLTIVGVVLAIIGLLILLGSISSLRSASATSSSSEVVIPFLVGGALITIGMSMVRFGMIGPVAGYVATEAAPAIAVASEAVARGVSEALEKSGGIPIKVQDGEAPAPQGIRVKCRNCGYLETEDADFCSKCGKPL